MTDIWTEALEGLRPRLGSETYDLWFRPLQVHSIEGRRLTLRASSQFVKEWLENHYREPILDEIAAVTGEPYELEVIVVATPLPAPEPEHTEKPALAETVVPAPMAREHVPPPTGLADRYRFCSFIKGASNELAASAAHAVAEEPGRRFNPLFLYGGVGLGKTHLLHAVGHALHENHRHLRIVYLSAERFMNEFISAVRYNRFDEFRRRYREDCDALLIDDIQFISGRDRTMDEFFHVFNALYEAGKQIMVTADRTPSDMQGMEERITSRLNWGLVADVKAPDLETRVAILRQKAEAEHIPLTDRVAVELAGIVQSNVRELEGALLRVSTFASLKGVSITEDFVHEVFEGERRPTARGVVTIDLVQKAVASRFSLRLADLKGIRRHKGVARPRMIAMYLCRELTGASYPEIGMRFGGKDHSTVINACKRVASFEAEEPELRVALQELRHQLLDRRAVASA